MELVYMDGRKEPYTTHDIIAEHGGITIGILTALLHLLLWAFTTDSPEDD